MIKIGSLTFDIYDDATGEIARKLPGEMHTVKVAAHEAVESLHDHQFALVMKTASGVRRRYPLDTQDAVKLSYAYFGHVKDTLHPSLVIAAEKKFAEPNSMAVAYVDVTALEPVVQKTASAIRVFGLTIGGRECFPLHDAALTKTAIARFPGTMIELSPIERFQYGRNISKQASALGVSIPDNSPIRLYTANELNVHSLGVAIDQRKEAAGHRMSTEVLDQLKTASGCILKKGDVETDASFAHRQKIASHQRGLPVDKIILVLSNFDKLAAFDSYHYLKGMLDPFAACFKQAGYETDNQAVDGVDLSKLDPTMLAEKFDPEFIQAFQQNPVQIYMSSPDPIKSIIREMALSGTSNDIGNSGPGSNMDPMAQKPQNMSPGSDSMTADSMNTDGQSSVDQNFVNPNSDSNSLFSGITNNFTGPADKSKCCPSMVGQGDPQDQLNPALANAFRG